MPTPFSTITLALCAVAVSPIIAAEKPASTPPLSPRNIILFIADGCGESTHRAFELWQGEPARYQDPEWDRYNTTTFALRTSIRPSRNLPPLEQDPRLVYDPAKAWNTTPTDRAHGDYPFFFEGYRWLRATASDSANTASAILTGVPTYRGAINLDGANNPTRSLAEAASDRGLAVGVVTSVPFNHATPACAAGAHVPKRDMYHQIARQMLTSGVCDVLAGAGHPGFDRNGSPREEPKYTYISEEDWSALRAGTLADVDGSLWTLVDETATIRSLATGEVQLPLFLLAPVAQTLQQTRAPWALRDATPPGGHPFIEDMPTLRDLTLAALNGLDDDPDGFFLVVEGGAIDWAMHDNQIGRMIEEMTDFVRTVEAVCNILDAGDRGYDWSNTLVIVTADHDHLLLGPESETIPFQPLTDNGPGVLPGYKWHANTHSNLPVPMFVRGCGSGVFAEIPTMPDTHAAPDGRVFERQPYFHQAEIGRTLLDLLEQPLATTPQEP